MKYGHFDDKNKEYVITDPRTPSPWINYLGHDQFFSLISNTLGGYSFYKDAKLRRITRYRYNNVPSDVSGRFYYIKDNGVAWNVGYLPMKTPLDSYECRHGLGYTIVDAKKNGLRATVTCFVPNKKNAEANKLVLANESDETKDVKLFACAEFCLYNAIDDATNFQRNLNIAEVEVDSNCVYHKTEYRERRNHFSFFYCSKPHDYFDSDRDSFLGLMNGFDDPEAVRNGKCSDSIASGLYPIGAHQVNIRLQPGERKALVFILGYVENEPEEKFIAPNVINKTKAYELIESLGTPEKFDGEFAEAKAYWDKALSVFHVRTGDDKFDRMANVWNQYQCMITYCISRSASYYETGTGRGMGFRDSCQDLLGFVHMIPSLARQRIIDIASIQFEDGSTYHQYQPLTKRGNGDVGTGFNDDPLWLVAATEAYIRETGDYGILKVPTPFNNAIGSEKPLYEHLCASMKFVLTHLGPHGLPLIGRADWNDCLNLNCFSEKDGEPFQTTSNFESGVAESVFIAAMFVIYGKDFVAISRKIKRTENAETAEKAIDKMNQNVKKSGWDGDWYLRAYDAFGRKIGSKECEEGRIFIETQGFCSLAGIGEEDKMPEKALASTEKYLVDDYGVELVYPPFTHYQKELGEISSYPPGCKENGSVFCHTNPWITLAYCSIHEGDKAFAIYKKNAPAYIESDAEKHTTEPYVYSQTIAGRASKRYGQAKNSWLTGTASWSFVALSQGILGIIPDYEGLRIAPTLPSSMKEVHVTRVYQGTTYNILIHNHGGKLAKITVDGKPLTGDIIPPSGKKKATVEVLL
jgi:cellobiose phosphorylase